VGGHLVGGASELLEALASGAFQSRLAEAQGAALPPELRRAFETAAEAAAAQGEASAAVLALLCSASRRQPGGAAA
jgi:hypothetical protein